ncbi:MAG: IS1182 family transposase [Candidatus Aenigmatarchaeota archaeon]
MNYIIGTPRDQQTFLSQTFDDLVNEDNPVRFIDAYVNQLDIQKLGFVTAVNTTGRPPYHPGLFIKGYLYAYLNKIRTSRRIQNEFKRNVELIWLAEGLQPDFRTISDFRKINAKALKNLFKEFLLLCKKLDLISMETVGVDGTKIRAQNNITNVFHRENIDELINKIDEKIAEYLQELDANDSREDNPIVLNAEKVAQQIKTLKKQRDKMEQAKAAFDENPEQNVVFATYQDSRMMSDKGKIRPGYNPQTATDAKHKLLVVGEVTQDANDLHQMTPMLGSISQTKKELGIETRTTVELDSGYHCEEEVLKHKDSREFDIVTPSPKDSPKKQNPDSVPRKEYKADKFKYDQQTDSYVCPGGKTLCRITPDGGAMVNGRRLETYQCKGCASCDKRELCKRGEAGRAISHSVNHQEMEAFRNKMKTADYVAKINQRKELCEHPFGTLKRGFGFDHFLLKGIEKVQGEFSLMCCVYNIRRVLSIVGVAGLLSALRV